MTIRERKIGEKEKRLIIFNTKLSNYSTKKNNFHTNVIKAQNFYIKF
jgi:hypothetical protein